MKIGVDIGNYDTKTQHTSTPSGYTEYEIKPLLEKEYLLYNGRYYAPTIERFDYVRDKTENDQALILALFGIAKEMLAQIKEKCGEGSTRKDIQTALSDVTSIALGVGLPVGDIMTLKDKTMDYFRDQLSDIIEIEYCGYKCRFLIRNIAVFPQDVLPVTSDPNCNISNKYKKYLIVGVGGQTVDIIPVVDDSPIASRCVSLREGVRKMFSDIIGDIEMNFGMTIGEDSVENVILGNNTPLPEDMELSIRRGAQAHSDHLLNACVQRGMNFIEYPTVFFGGGALLLRPYLENSKLLHEKEFLPEVRGNAIYYAQQLPD